MRPYRKCSPQAFLLAWAILGLSSTAHAQHVADFVPAETAVILRYASIDRVVGGWNDLLTAIGAPATQGLQYTEMGVGELLNLPPDSKAADRTQPAYVGVMFLADLGPDPRFFLVKANDENAVRRSVLRIGVDAPFQSEPGPAGFQKVSVSGGRACYFGKAGQWILYAQSEVIAKRLSETLSGPKLSTVMDARSREIFDSGEASVFVNVDAITERFKQDIQRARQDADMIVAGIASQIPPNAGDPAVITKAMAEAARLGFNALEDARSVAASASFSSAGVGAAALATVSEGSSTDKLFASNPASMIETIGNLPKDAAAYFGVHFGKDLFRDFTAAMGAGQYASTVKDPKAHQAAIARVAELSNGPSTGSFSLAQEGTIGMVALNLTQTDDAEALRKAYRALVQTTGELTTPAFSQSIEVLPDAETYKARLIDVVKTKVMLKGEGAEIGAAVMERLFGGSTLDVRTIALDGVMAQATNRDPNVLHKLIDSLESGEGAVGLEESYSQTRDKLAEKANLVVLLNAPQIVIDVMKIARELPGVGMLLGQFNLGARPAPSYAGLSINTEPQGLRVQAFVPASQPREILRIFAAAF